MKNLILILTLLSFTFSCATPQKTELETYSSQVLDSIMGINLDSDFYYSLNPFERSDSGGIIDKDFEFIYLTDIDEVYFRNIETSYQGVVFEYLQLKDRLLLNFTADLDISNFDKNIKGVVEIEKFERYQFYLKVGKAFDRRLVAIAVIDDLISKGLIVKDE